MKTYKKYLNEGKLSSGEIEELQDFISELIEVSGTIFTATKKYKKVVNGKDIKSLLKVRDNIEKIIENSVNIVDNAED